MLEVLAGAGLNAVGGALNAYGNYQGAKAAGKVIKGAQTANTNAGIEQQGFVQPYATEGAKGLTDYSNAVRGDDAYKQFDQYKMGQNNAQADTSGNFKGVDITQDPGAQYRMDQSTKALDASAGAKGSLFSGAQQKALQANAQNLASQEYGNAYNRQYGQYKDTETANRDQYNQNRTYNTDMQRYKMGDLQNLTQVGQNASGQQVQIGQNTQQGANTLAGYQADNAATRAAGPWNVAGSIMSGAGGAASDYGKYKMMSSKNKE